MKSKVFYWLFGAIGVVLIVMAIATYAMTHRYISVDSMPFVFDQFTEQYVLMAKGSRNNADIFYTYRSIDLGTRTSAKWEENGVVTNTTATKQSVPKNKDNITLAYNTLLEAGVTNMGSLENFESLMGDSYNRKLAYETLKRAGVTNMGDFDNFEKNILGCD